MDPNAPIVIGLAGQAGSGKTVTANGLAPTAQIIANICSCKHDMNEHMQDLGGSPCAMCDCREFNYKDSILWTHLFYALPIYRIVTARQKMKGENSHNRIFYEIHEAIIDLFGRSPLYSPIKSYDDLVALVKYVATIPCEPEGEKPRTFMQEIGSLFREYNEDVFVDWIARKIQEEYREFKREYTEFSHPGLKFGVVVSDIRMLNEAEFIAHHVNGSLYKLTASPEVLRERLYNRDGKLLTVEQANHQSEQELGRIPEDLFDEIINTDDFSVSDQVNYVSKLVSLQYRLSV